MTKTRASDGKEITSYTEESPEYGTLTFYGPGLTKPDHEIKMQPNVLDASPDTGLMGNNHGNGSNGLGVAPGQSMNAGGAMGSPTQNTGGAMTQTAPDNMQAIRQSLIARGINDNRIGWNDGYVTIDGRDAYKPEVNIDSTTYADTATINRMANDAYAASGNPLQAARQYIDSLGLGDIVDWDNETGMVNIGGTTIKPAYVSDGIAYVPKSQLDAAAQAYKQRTGVDIPQAVNERYKDKYENPRDAAIDRLLNREEFSYDKESDPVYQSYRDHYTRAAEDAYRSMVEANNTSLYGASGAVLAQAMAARDAQLRALDDKVPELYDAAYGRYNDETQRLRNNYADLRTDANDYFNREYGVQADTYDRQRQERQDYYGEQQRQFENEQTAQNNDLLRQGYSLDNIGRAIGNRSSAAQADMAEWQAERYPEMLDADIDAARLANDLSRTQLDAAKQEYILNKGLTFRFWTRADAAVVPELYDLYTLNSEGKFVDSTGSIVNPQQFALDYAAKQAYENNYYSGLGTIDAKMGMRRF